MEKIFQKMNLFCSPSAFLGKRGLYGSTGFLGIMPSWQPVLVQREMDFCLIGVNRKWVTVTNLF
jgi:hypothetical protein